MKYVPPPVEEVENDNENVPEKSEFAHGMRVIFRVALLGVGIYLLLGGIVDFAVPYIPASWEDSLAGPIMSEAAAGKPVAKRFPVDRIQQLLDSLATHMPGIRRKFTIHVLEKDETNALALPGGHIIVYSQLLEKIESENELAMVLAHELGHFAARDHLRGLGRSFLFFIVSSALLGGDSSSSRAFMNSSGILQNNYSRAQEYAADRFALDILVKKYGHNGGAVDFFKRLTAEETLPQLVHYLSTHPASEKRIAALNKIAAENRYLQKETLPVFWINAEKVDEQAR